MSIRNSLPIILALSSVAAFAQTTPPDFFGGVFGTSASPVQFVVLDANLNTVEENPPITNILASGTARVIIRYERPAAGPKKATVLVSFDVNAADASVIRLAHIHKGGVGANGPVVLDFNIPELGTFPVAANGSTHIQKQFEVTAAATLATIGDIIANPSAFYFNVHSVANPGGVLRGQLTETNLSAIRRVEAKADPQAALLKRLVVQLAAREGLITLTERDALLAQ